MATVAALTIIRLYWWPGGWVASHIYLVGKIYKLRSMIRRAKCFSKALDQLVISLRYRMATVATLATDCFVCVKWTITCGDCQATLTPQKLRRMRL